MTRVATALTRLGLLCLALVVVPAGSSAAASKPQLGPLWTTEVVATSARLHAEINPEGAATTYHFNYLTNAAYEANLAAGHEGFTGAAKAPAGADPSIGSGSSTVSVYQSIGGLAPETAYRYRVVAANAEGQAESEPFAFTTEGLGGSSLLLDGRGWEMVSPVEKNGGAVAAPGTLWGGGVLAAAASGEAATFSSSASFGAGAAGAPPASQYLSRRTPTGWQTQNITPSTPSGGYGDTPNGVPYQLFSGDLSLGLLLNGARCETEPCPRSYSLWEGGAFSELTATSGLRFEGASPDLRHLLFAAPSGLYEWGGGGLEAISEAPGASLAAQSGAISANGSRVYFDDEGRLYLHEGGATHQVDEAQGGGGAFQTASANGAFAFYTKAGTLYRYSAQTQASEAIATEVTGVLGASEDGSAAYLQSSAGLERWQAPAAITQIAPGAQAAQPSDWPPATGTARVSADGQTLAFLSRSRLSGYDNTDQQSGQPDSQVFLWSTNGGVLTCVSCNPTGERPQGPSTIPGAIANGTATDSYKPRALAASGRRLFFDSADALVLQDTDGAPDVYEWEAAGEGSCQRAGGCLALLSGGRAAEGASFIDASQTGADAFFLTAASLLPQDPGSADLYDARIGGGFAEPPAPIECEGDACQSLPPEPEDPEPGTLHSGPGNPPLPALRPVRRCKPGFLKRHGRCLPKRHHRKRGRR